MPALPPRPGRPRPAPQATGIPAQDLKRALQSLACVKGRNVLRKEPAGKDVGDGDVFFFNDKFTSKLIKVKISTVAATKVRTTLMGVVWQGWTGAQLA